MAKDFGNEDKYFDDHPIYDLRTIYAKDLLGDTLKKVKLARELRNFSVWFGLVRWDLYADLFQKFDKEEIKEIDDKIIVTEKIINQYPNAFLKKTQDPEEVQKVIKAIWELEVLMKNISEEHNIYGRAEMEDEGL